MGSNKEVLIDEFNKTSNSKVYAAGDIADKINLTPVALRTGAIISQRLFKDSTIPGYDYNQPCPSAIFTHPEVSSVGLSTAKALELYGKSKLKSMKIIYSGIL